MIWIAENSFWHEEDENACVCVCVHVRVCLHVDRQPVDQLCSGSHYGRCNIAM